MMPPCMRKRHPDVTRYATTPFLYEVAYTTLKQDNGGADHAMMKGMYEDDRVNVTILNNYIIYMPHGVQGVEGSNPFIPTRKMKELGQLEEI